MEVKPFVELFNFPDSRTSVPDNWQLHCSKLSKLNQYLPDEINIILAALKGDLKGIKMKLNMDVDVNFTDELGRTALMAASQEGHKDVVVYLVQQNANVNQVNNSGLTALAYSIQSKHHDIQNYLLLQNADLEAKDQNGRTMFMKCVASGNLEIVNAIDLLGCDIFHREKGLQKNSLMIAAEHGFLDIVQYLISQGCRKSPESSEKLTPLQYAFINNHTAVSTWIEYLSIEGENGTSQNQQLMKYAGEGNGKAVLQVLKKGCDVNCMDSIFNTPLIIASQKGSDTCVKQLIKYGALVNRRNSILGRTPLFMAVINGHSKVVHYLLEAKASANIPDRRGRTPLMGAAQELYVDIGLNLLQHGAQATKSDNRGKSVLAFAAQSGCVELGKLLFEYGASANVVDVDGTSPLERAASGGHMDMVKLLVASRADIDHINNSGEVAMDAASKHGHNDIILYLITCGARHPVVSPMFDPPSYQIMQSGRTDKIIDRKDVLSFAEKLQETSRKKEVEEVNDLIDKEEEQKLILHETLFAICNDQSFDETAVETILKMGFDINSLDKNGNNLLLLAIKNRHPTRSEWILNNGADIDVNYQDKAGKTALMYVCEYGDDKLMTLLLGQKADVNLEDNEGCTALLQAARFSNEYMAELLLQSGAKSNHQDFNGVTSLMLACQNCNIKLTTILLKYNALLNFKDSFGRTALFYSTLNHLACVDIIQVLSDSGASIEEADGDGSTPLMLSIQLEHVDIARKLISLGANINHVNKFEQSILFMAANTGSLEILNLLAQYYKQIDSTHINSVLEYLIYNNQLEGITLLCQNKTINSRIKEMWNVELFENLCRQNNTAITYHFWDIHHHDIVIPIMDTLQKVDHLFDTQNSKLIEFVENLLTSSKHGRLCGLMAKVLPKGCYEVTDIMSFYESDVRMDVSTKYWQTIIIGNDTDITWSNSMKILPQNTQRKGTVPLETVPVKDICILQHIQFHKNEKELIENENKILEDKLKKLKADIEEHENNNNLLQMLVDKPNKQEDSKQPKDEWQECECGKTGCPKCDFEQEASVMFEQNNDAFTTLPEDGPQSKEFSSTNETTQGYQTPGQGSFVVKVLFLRQIEQVPKKNVRLISVIHHNDKPYPKISLFKFHATVSQCSIDGRQMPSNACAIIAMLFAQKFVKKPVIIPAVPPPTDIPDLVFKYVEYAIREGNQVHELNYEGMPVDLGPEEVSLLTTHLGVRLVRETDIDTREPATLLQHVMNLKPNQVILFIKNYKVVSIFPCNNNKWLLLFDSHPHQYYNKMCGAYLFFAKKDENTIVKLFKSYDSFCDPRPFYGKFAIFEV